MSVRTLLAALGLIVVCANTGYAQTAEELQSKMRGPCKDSDQTYTLIDLAKAHIARIDKRLAEIHPMQPNESQEIETCAPGYLR